MEQVRSHQCRPLVLPDRLPHLHNILSDLGLRRVSTEMKVERVASKNGLLSEVTDLNTLDDLRCSGVVDYQVAAETAGVALGGEDDISCHGGDLDGKVGMVRKSDWLVDSVGQSDHVGGQIDAFDLCKLTVTEVSGGGSQE